MSKLTDALRSQGYGDEDTLCEEARRLGYGVWPGIDVMDAWIQKGGSWKESWWPDGKGGTVKYVCPVRPAYDPTGWGGHRNDVDAVGQNLVGSLNEYSDDGDTNTVLMMLWESRRDDGSQPHLRYIQAVIDTLCAMGKLTGERALSWHRSILTCPGHDPCRGSCAYCGPLK